MLLTDIYYQAGEIEARAVRDPSWARPHNPAAAAANQRRGPRRLLGRALINLGRAIAAEPAPVGRVASLGRQ
jgi:hypothetical protein